MKHDLNKDNSGINYALVSVISVLGNGSRKYYINTL